MPGLHYEDLDVDSVHRHEIHRTVTEADNLFFTVLTMNPQPLHLDEEYAKGTEYGTRIVNSMFTLALVMGLSVTDLTLGTTLGNLGMTDVQFPFPVRAGDTIRAETTIVDKRESRSRPDAGIVTFEHRGFNQDDVLVASCRRTGLMKRRQEDAVRRT